MLRSWPAGLKPISGGFAPSVRSISGGQSLSGFEQVGSGMSDRWAASFAFNVADDATALTLRAFIVGMRGRANSVLLPAFDLARAPWAVDAYGRSITPASVRNRQLDATPYADPSTLRQNLISAKLVFAGSMNATALGISMVKGGEPQPGHLFSIGRRLHMVETVVGTGPYTIEIWPWLREDVAIGAAMEFAAPVCEMRFASDGEGADMLAQLAQLRKGTFTLKFDEVP